MQWGCFLCPSCSQKRENTVFQLVLRNAWELSVSVSKLLEVVLHVGKGTEFWVTVHKVNSCQDISSRDASVGNRKNFKKQAQSSKRRNKIKLRN